MSNATEAKPEVFITLDRPRRFCVDWNAMRALEKRVGKKAVRAIDWNDPGFDDLTLILWAGLLSDDPTLTDEFVGKYLNLDKLKELESVITAAARAAMPKEEEGAEQKNELTTTNEAKT